MFCATIKLGNFEIGVLQRERSGLCDTNASHPKPGNYWASPKSTTTASFINSVVNSQCREFIHYSLFWTLRVTLQLLDSLSRRRYRLYPLLLVQILPAILRRNWTIGTKHAKWSRRRRHVRRAEYQRKEHQRGRSSWDLSRTILGHHSSKRKKPSQVKLLKCRTLTSNLP
jgi:hypothetical protein